MAAIAGAGMTTSERQTMPTGLDDHGASTYVPPTAKWGRRRRRPTGAPPPLPRKIGTSGKLWLAASIVLITWMVVTVHSSWARRITDQVDAAILRGFARARTEWLNDVMRAVDRAATGWTMFFVALALLVSMVVFRRWRHLFTFLASVVVVEIVGASLIEMYTRPRPYDVTIIGRWLGYALPSAATVIVSFTVVGIIYAVFVPGQPRTVAKFFGAVVVALVALARLYLGVDHPFDILTGVAIGAVIPLLAFRFFTPNEFFPVVYRRGRPPISTSTPGAARRSAEPCRISSASPSSTSGRSGSPGPVGRHHFDSASPATRTPMCSGSSTR
jgi:membrane-associated phospholipid phosphatase